MDGWAFSLSRRRFELIRTKDGRQSIQAWYPLDEQADRTGMDGVMMIRPDDFTLEAATRAAGGDEQAKQALDQKLQGLNKGLAQIMGYESQAAQAAGRPDPYNLSHDGTGQTQGILPDAALLNASLNIVQTAVNGEDARQKLGLSEQQAMDAARKLGYNLDLNALYGNKQAGLTGPFQADEQQLSAAAAADPDYLNVLNRVGGLAQAGELNRRANILSAVMYDLKSRERDQTLNEKVMDLSMRKRALDRQYARQRANAVGSGGTREAARNVQQVDDEYNASVQDINEQIDRLIEAERPGYIDWKYNQMNAVAQAGGFQGNIEQGNIWAPNFNPVNNTKPVDWNAIGAQIAQLPQQQRGLQAYTPNFNVQNPGVTGPQTAPPTETPPPTPPPGAGPGQWEKNPNGGWIWKSTQPRQENQDKDAVPRYDVGGSYGPQMPNPQSVPGPGSNYGSEMFQNFGLTSLPNPPRKDDTEQNYNTAQSAQRALAELQTSTRNALDAINRDLQSGMATITRNTQLAQDQAQREQQGIQNERQRQESSLAVRMQKAQTDIEAARQALAQQRAEIVQRYQEQRQQMQEQVARARQQFGSAVADNPWIRLHSGQIQPPAGNLPPAPNLPPLPPFNPPSGVL